MCFFGLSAFLRMFYPNVLVANRVSNDALSVQQPVSKTDGYDLVATRVSNHEFSSSIDQRCCLMAIYFCFTNKDVIQDYSGETLSTADDFSVRSDDVSCFTHSNYEKKVRFNLPDIKQEQRSARPKRRGYPSAGSAIRNHQLLRNHQLYGKTQKYRMVIKKR